MKNKNEHEIIQEKILEKFSGIKPFNCNDLLSLCFKLDRKNFELNINAVSSQAKNEYLEFKESIDNYLNGLTDGIQSLITCLTKANNELNELKNTNELTNNFFISISNIIYSFKETVETEFSYIDNKHIYEIEKELREHDYFLKLVQYKKEISYEGLKLIFPEKSIILICEKENYLSFIFLKTVSKEKCELITFKKDNNSLSIKNETSKRFENVNFSRFNKNNSPDFRVIKNNTPEYEKFKKYLIISDLED